MKINPKRIFLVIVGTLAALVLFYVIGYILAVSSEPFAYAKNQLSMSDTVKQKIGEPQKFSLDFFGYAVRHDGPKGRAEFSLTAIGTKGKAKIHVKLETDLGAWRVIGIRINDELVPVKRGDDGTRS